MSNVKKTSKSSKSTKTAKTTKSTKAKKASKKKNKIGFTLIELLAVIIILGILLLVAIPSVTSYISDSRKRTYIITAKSYISGAKNLVNKGDLKTYDTDTTYYLPISCINIESGGASPYGEFGPAYVLLSYDGNGYDYYWASTDTAKMGIIQTGEAELKEEDVKPNIVEIDTGMAMGSDSKVVVIDKDNCQPGEAKVATSAFMPKDKDATEKYRFEYTPLLFNFANESTYVKSVNGQISRVSLRDEFNRDVWHSINNGYSLFLRLNSSDLTEYANFKISLPRIYDNETGKEAKITGWYYEQYIEKTELTSEKWVCRGTASETSVSCTPKETYVAKSFTPAANASFRFYCRTYAYLEDGTYVKLKNRMVAHGLYVFRNGNYNFPTNFIYVNYIPN